MQLKILTVFQKFSLYWLGIVMFGFTCSSSLATPTSKDSTMSSSLSPSTAINIQEVKTNKNLTAWMVESHDIPVLSVVVAFKKAGYAAEPEGSSGLVRLLSALLDEGAGEWDSQGFKKFLLEKNIELSIGATQDIFYITFRTTKKNIDDAFYVLKAILSAPRFEGNSLDLIKNQMLTSLQQSLQDENFIATNVLNEKIFGAHPYGKTAQKILKEFGSVTANQLRQFMKNRLARDQMIISAAGDITPNELKDLLDKTFGDFPAEAVPLTLENVSLLNLGTTIVESLNIPQSLILFTQPGIDRHHPDYYAAFVMMKIIGDRGFESRLWNEVREKKGLAYGIDASIHYSSLMSLFFGSTATKNTSTREVIDTIRKVWQESLQGFTAEELEFVKKRTIGGFGLQFSSTFRIVSALLMYQIDNLGLDFVNKRNKIIEALTLEDINRVAKNFLKPEKLTFVVVGNPDNLAEKEVSREAKSGATVS